ncbi:DUF5908 family protein [Mucilaginibacter celer]|uniref:DUF5908 family protein n=1 Tax=Mucilaginibacter celer TaxID=2305508 RepID=UPI0013CEA477|nr:DUF5908 family protein [Mucilaginibacter celer]
MPVEIRELIIKTAISTGAARQSEGIKEKDLNAMKRQLLEECKRLFADTKKRNDNKR